MLLVFSTEVGRVVVANLLARTRRIHISAEHESPGFLKSNMALTLHRAHVSDGLEVVMKSGGTHSKLSCDFFDTTRFFSQYEGAQRRAQFGVSDRSW